MDELEQKYNFLENGGIDTSLIIKPKKTSKIMAIFRAIRNLLFGTSKENENNIE